MKVVGLITEYNPFTRGHAWHLEKSRELADADYCVAVMSGDYVQRGEPAIFSKHVRARMALAAGINAVFELPVDTSTGSAEFFAAGAVSLLESLGCVDTLVFGSEHGNMEPFLQLAPLLAKENSHFQESLRLNLKNGLSFPAARAQALTEIFGGTLSDQCRDLLDSPNNILGLEYCKALYRQNSSIRPLTIKRQGAGYHDISLKENHFPSASALRHLLQPDPENLSRASEVLESFVPESLHSLYRELLCEGGPLFPEDFSLLLFTRILEKNEQDLQVIWDLSPELASRILRLAPGFSGWNSFISAVKTRDMTQTRVQRALLHLLLDLRSWQAPTYARLLGFRRDSTPLLSEIKKTSRIPLISKLANASEVLSSQALSQLKKNTSASQLYQAVYSQKYHLPFIHEFQKQVEIL